MDRIALRSFLAGHRYGVVSSISGDGTPQSALVGVGISPEMEIIFDTVKSSRKYANLIARPNCSFVVGWAGEQTVQFEGIASEPKGPDFEALPGNLLQSLAGGASAFEMAGHCLLCGTAPMDSLQRR